MDDETLTVAFKAHADGQEKFTRRMAITIADMADMRPMSLVWRLEKLGLLKRGSWEWFKREGGITAEQVQEVRAGRMADAMSTIADNPECKESRT
jgi:hypothetical protein